MNRIITILAAGLALFLTGCATNYDAYIKAVEAQSAAETSRLVALTRIAESGDASAKSAAVMALALSGGKLQAVQPPRSVALEWASLLVPSLTNLYGIHVNAGVQKMQIASQESQYGMTLGAITGVAGQGLSTSQTLGLAGMDYASKPPVVVQVPMGSSVLPTETPAAETPAAATP
jgi:hypothetical protein